MERPETGGVWMRDPKTGALSPADASLHPPPPEPDMPAATADEPAPEAPPARPKKGR